MEVQCVLPPTQPYSTSVRGGTHLNPLGRTLGSRLAGWGGEQL